MNKKFLKLNEQKTEILLVGPLEERQKLQLRFGSLSQQIKSQVTSLGVILDLDLNFISHFNRVAKISFFHLRNIAKIRPFLTQDDAETLVHAFITSRLDYCNSLFTGLPRKSLKKLQVIRNAAARILTNTKKRDHISPQLASLHWLPVSFRIDFKILLFIFKALNNLAPSYICDCLSSYAPTRTLRSSTARLLAVPKVSHKKNGEAAFCFYGPK